MRNRLTWFLLAALLLPLLAACGSGTGTQPGATAAAPDGAATAAAPAAAPASGTTVETAAPVAETSAAATPAVAEATTTGGETATAGATEMATTAATAGVDATTTGATAGGKKLKIGMVTDIAKLGDKGFNDSAWAGVQQGAQATGSESKVIETTDPNDYEKNIGQFVSAGYDVIVTVGFALQETTAAAAKANGKLHFIGVDQAYTPEQQAPNLTGLIFEEDKAGFLAGALAALYSKSGKLGAVLGTDAVPAVWRFGEGYRAGAKHVKSDVNVQTVYHSDVGFDKTFSDPEWGKATALSMIDQGVDVVFGAGGRTGNGALLAAADRKDKGVVAIGVDTDQYLTVPEAKSVLLSSAVKIIDQGVADLLKQVSTGSIKGGNVTGKVGLAPFHELESKISPEIKSQIEQLGKQLEDGSLKTNVAPAKPSS